MIHTDGIQTIANAERRVGDRRKRGIHEAMGETLYAEQDASLGFSVRTPEPLSPSEAALDAARSEALDYGAHRTLSHLHDFFAAADPADWPLQKVVQVLGVLNDEYRERYEAHRGR